ncbi:expressed unknown protein [Seminavis robusta]|uniref:Uncharacterized protein n=1 Tax=Seminavis robusta TaxID=568900 RepID=A0A9N8DKI8_9STRA|nr:expressed unknown protein [Seminavis robusta]|eukprot:Sro108_g054240.1 n/a (103) ;mRNA; f:75652-75960
MQHKEFLQGINNDGQPQAAFVQDFQEELKEWLATGDQIIVAGDVKESVFRTSVDSLLRWVDVPTRVHWGMSHPLLLLQMREGYSCTTPELSRSSKLVEAHQD